MTKDELKKEAEEKANIYFDSLEVDDGNVSDTRFSNYDVFVAYKKGALDFAEPREKRIAELEKENAELKAFKEKQNQDILILKGLTERQREENAELKEFVNAPHTKGRKTTRGDYIKTVWDLSKQLTKAKELLKRCYDNYFCLEPLRSEIALFLSEVEK